MINFEDKENTKVNNLPRKNTWTAIDMNEIKAVVNALAFTRVNVSGVGVIPTLAAGQLGFNTTDGILFLNTPSGMTSVQLYPPYNLDLVSSVPWSTHDLGTAAEWATLFGGATIVNFELLPDGADYRVRMLVIGNSVTNADLNNKNITKVNIFAVDGVHNLFFMSNEIEVFSPLIPLLISLVSLRLNFNNFTDYTLSEPWANAQTAFTNPCTIVFNGNPVSPIGTNLETILNTKNATLTF